MKDNGRIMLELSSLLVLLLIKFFRTEIGNNIKTNVDVKTFIPEGVKRTDDSSGIPGLNIRGYLVITSESE